MGMVREAAKNGCGASECVVVVETQAAACV